LLTPEKFEDINAGKGATKTWFISLEVFGPCSREKILFFFNRATKKIIEEVKASKVGLIASRFDGTQFQRLDSEPITLREIGYNDGELLFYLHDGSISRGNIRETLMLFLAELIQSYVT
jgi:hypothetical protein